MSRICALMPRLQMVEPSSAHSEPTSSGEPTTSTAWREPTSWWSVQESPRTLRCYARSRIVALGGSPNLSSPFGSSAVH